MPLLFRKRISLPESKEPFIGAAAFATTTTLPIKLRSRTKQFLQGFTSAGASEEQASLWWMINEGRAIGSLISVPIDKAIGKGWEMHYAHIHYLLTKQRYGQEGDLFVDGRTNEFPVAKGLATGLTCFWRDKTWNLDWSAEAQLLFWANEEQVDAN